MNQAEIRADFQRGIAQGYKYMLLLRCIDDGAEWTAYLRPGETPSQERQYWLRKGARVVKVYHLNKPF